MKLSIFTPTYNRAHLLPRLYESLCAQTCKDFEWLIVDDGSSDNTQQLIDGYLSENKITIKYISQKNGGKHRAINRGVSVAKGYLFMIVDSDDRLASASIVAKVIEHINFLENNQNFCAVVGNKVFDNYNTIGGNHSYETLDADFISYREKYKIVGDRAEVVKTSVMREFPFVEIEGENFCSESYIWTDMAAKYKARYFNEPYVICEYQVGGLSDSAISITRRNPIGSMICFAKYAHHPATRRLNKIRYIAYFWCYSFDSNKRLREKIAVGGEWKWILVMPLGLLYRVFKINLRWI